MTKEEFLEDRQNFITQVSSSIKLAASAWPLRHGRFGGRRLG
jgi:hypothetical protein